MYNNPYMQNAYNPNLMQQNINEKIDSEIAKLQQMKNHNTNQPAINQTFQLAPNNNGINQNTNDGFQNLHLSNQIEGTRDAVNNLSTQICGSTADIVQAVNSGFAGAEISANATVVVGEYTNITIKKRIRLCPRENVTLTIGSVPAISGVTPAVETVAPSIKNANIIIEPVRF